MLEKRSFSAPDETREFGHGKIEIIKIGGGTVGKTTFQPGWKWSNDVKPIAGTELCEIDHLGYIESGRLKVVLRDGTEAEAGPGDVFTIPAGHDAWVVGNGPVVIVDWEGNDRYAKR